MPEGIGRGRGFREGGVSRGRWLDRVLDAGIGRPRSARVAQCGRGSHGGFESRLGMTALQTRGGYCWGVGPASRAEAAIRLVFSPIRKKRATISMDTRVMTR